MEVVLKYTYLHMHTLTVDAIAMSCDFTHFLTDFARDKYIKRVEEHFTNTAPQMLKNPRLPPLMQLTHTFYKRKLGGTDFWKRLVSLLESELKRTPELHP